MMITIGKIKNILIKMEVRTTFIYDVYLSTPNRWELISLAKSSSSGIFLFGTIHKRYKRSGGIKEYWRTMYTIRNVTLPSLKFEDIINEIKKIKLSSNKLVVSKTLNDRMICVRTLLELKK